MSKKIKEWVDISSTKHRVFKTGDLTVSAVSVGCENESGGFDFDVWETAIFNGKSLLLKFDGDLTGKFSAMSDEEIMGAVK